MKTLLLSFFTLIMLCGTATANTALAPADSIGIKKINNQNYILHQVTAGETLSAIARRYNVGLGAIRQANPKLGTTLAVSQVILVPWFGKSNAANYERRVYTVQKGETLYGISRKFNIGLAQLRSLNQLQGNDIREGQELIVQVPVAPNDATGDAATAGIGSAPDPVARLTVLTQADAAPDQVIPKMHTVRTGEYLYQLSRDLNLPLDSLRAWNQLEGDEILVGQELVVGYQRFSPTGDLVLSTGADQGFYLPVEPETAATQMAGETAQATTATTSPDFMATAVDSTAAGTAAADMFNQPAVEAPGNAAVQSTEKGTTTLNAATQPEQFPVRQAPVSGKPGSGFQVINSNENKIPTSKRISGVGAMIRTPRGSNNSQFVALHRTAPSGTHIKVTNPSNGRSTVVKVIGKIPAGLEQKEHLLIMLSEPACQQIGIINDEFPIQMNYNE